jgi:hypothetical protein
VANAFAPAIAVVGNPETVYDGNTGGPLKRGLTEFVLKTSRQDELPSEIM